MFWFTKSRPGHHFFRMFGVELMVIFFVNGFSHTVHTIKLIMKSGLSVGPPDKQTDIAAPIPTEAKNLLFKLLCCLLCALCVSMKCVLFVLWLLCCAAGSFVRVWNRGSIIGGEQVKRLGLLPYDRFLWGCVYAEHEHRADRIRTSNGTSCVNDSGRVPLLIRVNKIGIHTW